MGFLSARREPHAFAFIGDIDTAATETIKVQGKRSGLWWNLGRKDSKSQDTPAASEDARPAPSRSDSSLWGLKKSTKEGEEAPLPPAPSRSNSSFWTMKGTKDDAEVSRPEPTRSGSDIFWPSRKVVRDEPEEMSSNQRPAPPKMKSDTAVLTARGTPKPPTPSRSNTVDSDSA